MNDPHTAHTALDQQDDRDDFEVTPDFLAFARDAFVVWCNTSENEVKSTEIAEIALRHLDGTADGPTDPHTQSVEDHRLESNEADALEAAVNRRVARWLMSHPSNF